MEAAIRQELPDECWATIFNKLDDHGSDWDSISLVCKNFLSITNSLKLSLPVSCSSVQMLSRLLQRFRHLKKIQLVGFKGDLNKAVLEIARSGLNLEELDLSGNGDLPNVCLQELGLSLKSLKVLICAHSSLTDADLVRIANCLPQLEELDISDSYFPHIVDGRIIAVTDEGVAALSSKLKRVRQVDLSGNQCISDKSLISLSSNCAFLEQVSVRYCTGVTEFGFSFLLHNSPRLTSLVLWAHFEIGTFGVKGCNNLPKSLQSLRLTSVKISDEFLKSMAMIHIPLNELTLSFCKGYTFSGISSLLHSYQSLKTLALLGAEFLTNEQIDNLSPFLRNLSSLQLLYCPKLSDSAFAMLSERCPLLSCLDFGETGLGQEECNRSPKNFAIRSLNLSYNRYLSSYSLRKILGICPNMENLNLSNCFQTNEKLDIADVFECNNTLKSLILDGCQRLKFSGTAVAVSKLEKITARTSGISDEVLSMFAQNSPRLLHLNLEDRLGEN